VLHRYYQGDVNAAVRLGFDSTKVDSCGAQQNLSLYGALFNSSGKAMRIEQCHQGQNSSTTPSGEGTAGQLGPDWCPFTTFRTSGDIINVWDRVMSNLMSVVPYLGGEGEAPLSRAGCFAYADMMEVATINLLIALLLY
jgi:hypothetical protein